MRNTYNYLYYNVSFNNYMNLLLGGLTEFTD